MLRSMFDDTDHSADDFDYAASQEARRLARGVQTAAQHRAAAIEVLRDIVDDPAAKPMDRRQAASDLAKLSTTEAEDEGGKAVMTYSDDELARFVEEARAQRVGNDQTTSAQVVPHVPIPDEFEFNLDDIPDRVDYANLL